MPRKAIAFTGPSGSGKTTIIEKISAQLTKSRKVAIIKHDPSDKAVVDKEGKDSSRFFATGADVALVSDHRTTLFTQNGREVSVIADMFGEFDLLMVEGLKTLPLPRIGIFRGSIEQSYLSVVRAIAIDESIDVSQYEISSDIDILDLNDTNAIINWIDQNSMEL